MATQVGSYADAAQIIIEAAMQIGPDKDALHRFRVGGEFETIETEAGPLPTLRNLSRQYKINLDSELESRFGSIQNAINSAAQSASIASNAQQTAIAAAEATGPYTPYKTKPAASAVADGEFIEVNADASQGGLRTRYQKVGGELDLLFVFPPADVGSLYDALSALPRVSGYTVNIRSFWDVENVGGGALYYDPNMPRSAANFLTIYDPTSLGAWSGERDAAVVRTAIEAQGSGSGSGCFVREGFVGSYYVQPEWSGAIADGTYNCTHAFVNCGKFGRDNNAINVEFVGGSSFYHYEQWVGPEVPDSVFGCDPMFKLVDVDIVIVRGNGHRIELEPTTRLGGFNPDGTPTYNDGNSSGGRFFSLGNNRFVDIEGVVWEGNSQQHVIGGKRLDTGWQTREIGLRISGDQWQVSVRNCSFENSAVDSMSIGPTYLNEDGSEHEQSIVFENVIARYSGRQGCSIIGGKNIRFYGCDIGWAGKAPDGSPHVTAMAPGAAVDFEPEQSDIKGVYFNNCRILNDYRASIVTLNGSTDIVFDECLIYGKGSFLFEDANVPDPAVPPIKFKRCTIYGTSVRPGSALFEQCTFRNTRDGAYPVDVGSRWLSSTAETRFVDCDWLHDVPDMPWLQGAGDYPGEVTRNRLFLRFDSDSPDLDDGGVGFLGAGISGSVEVYDQTTGSQEFRLTAGNLKSIGPEGFRLMTPSTKISDTRFESNAQDRNYPGDVFPVVPGGAVAAPALILSPNQAMDRMEGFQGSMAISNAKDSSSIPAFPFRYGDIVLFKQDATYIGAKCVTPGVGGDTAVFQNFGALES